MKTCSKCKRELDESQFVKSDRYLDGLYPSCKECRKRAKQATMDAHFTCSKCRTRPHSKGNMYCLECMRDYKDSKRTTPKKFVRRPNSTHGLCPECGIRPKRKGQGYCSQCSTRKKREWMKQHGGQWAYATNKGQRHKLVARARVSHLIQRGKIKRGSCEVCGKLNDIEAHHDDHSKPLEVRWLCLEHHDALEKWIAIRKKKLLTERK